MQSRRWPALFAALLLAASVAGSSRALALPRLDRDAAGVVQRVDEDAKTFQLSRSKDAPTTTLSWNFRTRFIEGAQLVDAAKLREGAWINVIYHSPFFGGRFVTKVVFGGGSVRPKKRADYPKGCGA